MNILYSLTFEYIFDKISEDRVIWLLFLNYPKPVLPVQVKKGIFKKYVKLVKHRFIVQKRTKFSV